VQWLTGCASSTIDTSKPSVLFAVRVATGGMPTPQQAEAVQRAMTPAVLRAGLQLASSLESADFVLTVTITPDPVNPGKGHIAVNGIERQIRSQGSKDLDAAWQRARELEQWGLSRSSPTY
jgi:hypothetical protein